jgi:hypothetical protein
LVGVKEPEAVDDDVLDSVAVADAVPVWLAVFVPVRVRVPVAVGDQVDVDVAVDVADVVAVAVRVRELRAEEGEEEVGGARSRAAGFINARETKKGGRQRTWCLCPSASWCPSSSA